MMGCGKSTIGEELAKRIDYDFVDCDRYLEKRHNTTIPECFAISESYFRDVESICLVDLSRLSKQVISTGGGCVTRDINMSLFEDDIVVFINRPLENILSDLDTTNRPLAKKDFTEIYNSRLDLYKKYCDVEVLNNSTVDDVVETIVDKIKELI